MTLGGKYSYMEWVVFYCGFALLALAWVALAAYVRSTHGIAWSIAGLLLGTTSIAMWHIEAPKLSGKPDMMYLEMMCFVITLLGYMCWMIAFAMAVWRRVQHRKETVAL